MILYRSTSANESCRMIHLHQRYIHRFSICILRQIAYGVLHTTIEINHATELKILLDDLFHDVG